jgi:O-antigen ligase
MVGSVYPEYRVATAVQEHNPHLHNVPMQIAAERGLPALGLWIWFVVAAAMGCGAAAAARATARSPPSASAPSPPCSRPALRVQLRRLRVPDAVPRPLTLPFAADRVTAACRRARSPPPLAARARAPTI